MGEADRSNLECAAARVLNQYDEQQNHEPDLQEMQEQRQELLHYCRRQLVYITASIQFNAQALQRTQCASSHTRVIRPGYITGHCVACAAVAHSSAYWQTGRTVISLPEGAVDNSAACAPHAATTLAS